MAKGKDASLFDIVEAVNRLKSEKFKIVESKSSKIPGARQFSPPGLVRNLTVTVWPDWEKDPQCTCSRSAAEKMERLYCDHILMVLVDNPEFICQLWDVL